MALLCCAEPSLAARTPFNRSVAIAMGLDDLTLTHDVFMGLLVEMKGLYV
jgi:hypothetical protein